MARGRICVIGISDFVGSHVGAELLSRGLDVVDTLRDPGAPSANWIAQRIPTVAKNEEALTLSPANLQNSASLRVAITGCSGVIMCAGVEVKEPETIKLMVGGSKNVLENAMDLRISRAVFTSSTGSTNPPDREPVRPTQFDLSRQDSLGGTLRDLDVMVEVVVEELIRGERVPPATS